MEKLYVNLIGTIGKENYNELKITVFYRKAGYNYYNGQKEDGGLYVSFKPVKRTNGIESYVMLSDKIIESGFKTKALSMNRDNKKKVARFSNMLTNDILEKIRDYYEKQEFSRMIENLGKNFK